MQKDLDQNSEFRIKYPRGELGQSAGEAELFMIVEHVSGLLEDVEEEIKGMRNNAVNIEFLKKRTEKLTEDVEALIRKNRETFKMIKTVFALALLNFKRKYDRACIQKQPQRLFEIKAYRAERGKSRESTNCASKAKLEEKLMAQTEIYISKMENC